MPTIDDAIQTARTGRDDALRDLVAFCEIPSISTLPENQPDVRRAGEWLAEQLRALGMKQTGLLETAGHPVVYGEWLDAPGKPTVLVYGHYDVQPVDPLDEWTSDPFGCDIRDEKLYARGASDMKAQIIAFLHALKAVSDSGRYPVNLKFLLEGEEEVGSPNLEPFVRGQRDRFACDVILNTDGGIYDAETPSITYGLRGLAYFELEVRGPTSDLHSGVFGGAVLNPAQALCELVAGMHDRDGRITLPGFYEAVRDLSDEERETLRRLPMDEATWRTLSGAPASWGEPAFSIVERIGARPTLEVNGIWGGFTGEGSKTVLPARANAKISMRLVPDQTPGEVEEQLRAYLEANAPEAVTWSLRRHAGANPSIMNRDTPYCRAAAAALRETWGVEPLFKREGGTIPVVAVFKEHVGADTVMLGFELPDAAFHGPNEHMHLPTFYRGIETYARFLLGV